jgi:hypothetical protein
MPSIKLRKKMEDGYREMADDTEHKREAAEWCEALMGDSSEAKGWFGKLDELNSEPFPARRQPATTKRDVFE